jgi:hypothetical protein
MSERHRHINWPHKISPEEPGKMLRVPIPVIAPALIKIGVIGNLQVALRHPQNVGLGLLHEQTCVYVGDFMPVDCRLSPTLERPSNETS